MKLKINPIKIGHKWIGEKKPCYVIAEIGSNWEGNYVKAKKIIRECKKAGVDAVKFQMWKAEELYNKSHPNWNEIKRSELSFQMAKKLKEFSDKQKIEFFCSAFYPDGVKFLISINVCVDPKYQGKWLFSKMLVQFEQIAKELDFDGIIGIANKSATPFWLRSIKLNKLQSLNVYIGFGKVETKTIIKSNYNFYTFCKV